MRVWSEVGRSGARAAASRGDVVVLVDALRSSVTITVALAVGVRHVVPASSVDEARRHLGRPGVLVAGERDGAQVPDFDYGNSPTQLLADAGRLESQVLVLATSNGTPLIQVAGAGARAVLAGSLPNAGAVTRAAFVLAGEAGCDVTLLAAGGESGRTVEDDYAMAVLASRIGALGAETELIAPISPAADVFKSGPNGQRLAALGYADDVLFCARVAVFENVGVLKAGNFVPWKSG